MTTLAKDFHRLVRRIDKLSNYQARIEWDERRDDTIDKFALVIQPNGGYYARGTFKFTVTIWDDYPSENAPAIWCETNIYHPNIDPTMLPEDESDTNVCCNLFDAGTWNPKFGLDGVVLGLIFLMHNPNIDSVMSPYCENCSSEEEFIKNVHRYMTGQDVCGVRFDDFAGMAKDNHDEHTTTYSENNTVINSDEIIAANTEDITNRDEIDHDIFGNEDTNISAAINLDDYSRVGQVTEIVADNNEITEEYMQKLLNERDHMIYIELVNKSVAELRTKDTDDFGLDNTVGVGRKSHDFVNENNEHIMTSNNIPMIGDSDEDGIDMSFVDGDFVILHTDVLTEENMLQLLQERDAQIYTDYIAKSIAEMPVETEQIIHENNQSIVTINSCRRIGKFADLALRTLTYVIQIYTNLMKHFDRGWHWW